MLNQVARVLLAGRSHGLGQRQLANGVVARERGGARIVERLLHVGLDTVQLGLQLRSHAPVQIGRHEMGGGYGRLDLVYPQLDVVAVRLGLPPMERHIVGRGLSHRLERLVGQMPLEEAGILHELRGEVGAVEALDDARELGIEAASAHVADAEHHRAAQRHETRHEHRGVRAHAQHRQHAGHAQAAQHAHADGREVVAQVGGQAHGSAPPIRRGSPAPGAWPGSLRARRWRPGSCAAGSRSP